LLEELDWPILLNVISSKMRIEKSKDILSQEIVKNWQDSMFLYSKVKRASQNAPIIDQLLTQLSPYDSLVISKLFSTINTFDLPDLDHVALFYNFFDTIRKSSVLSKFNNDNSFSFLTEFTDDFLNYFGQSIDHGQFLFHMIPGLRNATSELERIYFDILKLHKDNLSKSAYSELQNDELIFRDHRYCVAIYASSFDKKIGRIISHSNSGKTFYVEPHSFSKLNDSYQELLLKYEHIILQFKVETNRLLNLSKDSFLSIFNFILDLDVSRAKFLYSDKELVIPTFGSEKIELISLSHPLVDKPVSNDFVQDQSIQSLIVTGPNSSGKTIYLKSICLTLLMARYGIPLSCSSACIPLLGTLAYPSSSIQNIGEGTSSFVAEFDSLSNIFNEPGPRFIIWDEAFGNTSSRDATGLIISIVEHFNTTADSFFIISTHHDHLKILTKTMSNFSHCSTDPSFKFKVIKNFTSESNPFEALRNKRPNDPLLATIKGRAFEISSMNKDTLEEFYGDILKAEIERKNLYLNIKKSIISLEKFIQESELSFTERQKALIQLDKIKAEFIEKPPAQNTNQAALEIPTLPEINIEIGANYRSRSLGVPVKVVAAVKKGYECLAKGKRIVLPLEDLVDKSSSKSTVKINIQTAQEDGELTHDLRGKRREEFISAAERVIGYVILGKIPFAKIIFGKGDGALSLATRELEASYKDLHFDYSDDGGAVTIK